MKIWSGSVSPEYNNNAYKIMLDKDINIDNNLIKYEILSLMGYNLNIYEKNLINKNDSIKILDELMKLYNKKIVLNSDLEDVHGNIENIVINDLNDSGKNLRMFLSRNEQIHTDVNFFLIDNLIDYEKIIYNTLLNLNDINYNGIMPGYTHYRQAMPIKFKTYIDYIINIFVYNFNNINDVLSKLKELPLGYGSGFGSMSDVNFNDVASYFNMDKNIKNPLFSSLKYIDNYIEVISNITDFLIDISRIFQDLIIFSGDEMKIIELPEGYVTGSSLMPNKINPDFLEIFQGYAAKSISLMNLIYNITINKTTGYHRDFQIIKDEILPFIIELKGILNGLPEFFKNIKFKNDVSEKILSNSIYATYNSKLDFNKNNDWKKSYKNTGNKIKNNEGLLSYIPDNVKSFNDFDFIENIINNNVENFINKRYKILDKINSIISK